MNGFDDSELVAYMKKLEKAQKIIDAEFMKAAKAIGLEFMRSVKIRTPKGLTGKLNQNWQCEVNKKGNTYIINVFNTVEYASFVESGHRQEVGRYVPAIKRRLTKPWVEGKFMMKLTEAEIEEKIPAIVQTIENKLAEVLGGL